MNTPVREPGSGQDPVTPGPASGGVCPNCGSGRPDRFCSRCGQNDRDYMRGLWTVVYEFAREMFELDSRLFRTLKSLLFKPGHLSSEFSRNHRAAYMSPVRLYLFTSFLFFLVLSISAGGWLSNLDLSDDDEETDTGADRATADSVLSVVDSALADRGIAVGALVAGALGDSAPADRGLDVGALGVGALVDSVFAVAAQADSVSSPAAEEADAAAEDEPEGVTVPQLEAFKATMRPMQRLQVDDILGRSDGSPAKQLVAAYVSGTGLEVLENPGLVRRYFTGLAIDLMHDPDEFLQQAIGNLPVAMFFLLPFFALILALCYASKKRFFVEHLVFGMHLHTFVFLTLGAALLIPNEGVGAWFQAALILVPSVYFLIALRRFYGDGWRWTLVKGFVVWNLYACVLFPGLIIAFLVRT